MPEELGFPLMACLPFGLQFSPKAVKSGIDISSLEPFVILISEELMMVVLDLGKRAIEIEGSQLKRQGESGLGSDDGVVYVVKLFQ